MADIPKRTPRAVIIPSDEEDAAIAAAIAADPDALSATDAEWATARRGRPVLLSFGRGGGESSGCGGELGDTTGPEAPGQAAPNRAGRTRHRRPDNPEG